MSHVYKAYAAVHNSEKRNNLSEVRDEISEMNLKQLTDVDLYEVAEEVLEDVFAGGADIADAKKLIESVFTKASEGDSNPFREDKIDRLAEAFISAFEKVTERSLRTAVESYSEYRVNKERLEKWNDSNSTGNVNAKLHEKLVAQDRLIVKNGLESMIESYGNPAAKEEKLRKDDKLFGSPNKKKKVKEAYTVTAADKKGNTPAYQGLKAGKKNVKTGEPLYKAADHLKKEETELVDKLVESGKFTQEEIDALVEAERSIDDRLDRKNKLMKKTVKKAMDFARDEGEASGHARFNMSRLGREREKLIAKKK